MTEPVPDVDVAKTTLGHTASEAPASEQPPRKDPMKSFRGIMAGTLIMEAITVALALPVIGKLGGGIGTAQGWIVIGVAVVLIFCCGLVRRPWILGPIFALQLVLIAFVAALPAVSIIGVVFLAVWVWLVWIRRQVAKRLNLS